MKIVRPVRRSGKQWSGAHLNQVASTFLDITQSLSGECQATMPQLKEEMQGFHMSPISIRFFGEISVLQAECHPKPH